MTTTQPLTHRDVARQRELLASIDAGIGVSSPAAVGVDLGEQVRLIEELRALQAAAGAALARASLRFAKARVREAQAEGLSLEAQQASAVGELALAHRVAPSVMSRRVGDYRRLVDELPQTAELLAEGEIGEWVALIVARGARGLDPIDAALLDAELAPDLPALSPRQVEGRVKAFCLRVDPETQARKARIAAGEANVSCRPVADGMARVSILAPTADAVGMYAAVRRTAETQRTEGESLGRAMVGVAFQRLTGLASVDELPVEVQLVMTDQSFLDPASIDPARLQGGTGVRDVWIPAADARRLALGGLGTSVPGRADGSAAAPAEAPDTGEESAHAANAMPSTTDAPRWLRRLFTDPATGTLTGIDTRRRLFTPAQRRYIAARDQVCTTPWCDAPIRHIDHAVPHARGGPTDLTNGNGKCERCNQRKDHPGWATTATPAAPGRPHEITVTTPAGRGYTNTSPPVLRSPDRASSESRISRSRSAAATSVVPARSGAIAATPFAARSLMPTPTRSMGSAPAVSASEMRPQITTARGLGPPQVLPPTMRPRVTPRRLRPGRSVRPVRLTWNELHDLPLPGHRA